VLIEGDRVALPELVGLPPPAALIVNDADLTFATTTFDDVTLASLSAVAMDVGDALTETMCWNSAWHMVRHAQLGAASFCKLVARRLSRPQPIIGLPHLLERAMVAANWYADPVQRADLLAEVAAATLAAAEQQAPGSREQRLRVVGFASAAANSAQLDLLGTWLKGAALPDGVVLDLELRAKILPNLAARGLVADSDLSAYAADDPVAGKTLRATWAAHQPSLEAKEQAWAAALASPRADMARAHAAGFWVPGQEQLVGQFRERYFSQALPAIRNLEPRTAQRLARALYPATLADDVTLSATTRELDQANPADPTYDILLEQRSIMQQVIAARAAAASHL
jgi:aminopeptidase N